MKYVTLNDQLYTYICQSRSGAQDPLLLQLRRETESLGDESRMQISAEQGSFMTLLARLINARLALEIGTFTGYSSICIARGLAPDGKLICLDENRQWTDIARRYWAQDRLDTKIELRLGPAIPSLQNLDPNLALDFVFIDADKSEYDAYFELVLPRVRLNGVILFDNMVWGGHLGSGPIDHPSGRAIDALNRKLASDPRVETVLLPIADGIQLCRKRAC